MEAATVTVPQIEKRLVRNNTDGYVGVITLDHRGEEKGDNIDPRGTRWMSDAEIILTARAPRRAEDNPFEEHTFLGVDPETQRRVEFKMRPLTLESDAHSMRFTPTDRYVPPEVLPEGVEPAAQQTAAAVKDPAAMPAPSSPVAEPPLPPSVVAPTPVAPPLRSDPAPVAPVVPQSLAGSSSAPTEEEREPWVVEPEAPGQILTGSLGGEDGAVPSEEATAAPQASDAPTERYAPVAGQAQAAVQTPGVEEHASKVDPAIGEETGAARPPVGDQPEGEYAQAEEVGSPDAPAANEPTQDGG